METKDTKQYYIFVKNEKVQVSEEIYREYVRPVSAERKRRYRNSRCRVKGKKGHYIRCTRDCKTCEYYKAGKPLIGSAVSLDRLKDNGYEAASDMDIEVFVEEKEQKAATTAAINAAISKLTERQRLVVRCIYFEGKSQKELAEELGVTPASVSSALRAALRKLRKLLQEN